MAASHRCGKARSQMFSLKTGDKVKVIDSYSVHHGKVGTVMEGYMDGVPKARVRLDCGGVPQTYDEAGLEKLKSYS